MTRPDSALIEAEMWRIRGLLPGNPDPARITDEMWQLWRESKALIPGVLLGGIYANKRCYHNTVNANLANWPTAYCIQLPLDLQGPRDKARALDLTMSTTEMRKRTTFLRTAALHPEDTRLGAVREFYGTINGTTVSGLIRSFSGTWQVGTADATHLWHIHIGIYTAYCNVWEALRPIASVLSGQTWEQWQEEEDMTKDELFKFVMEQKFPWFSGAQQARMVARGWPADGIPLRQLFTYLFDYVSTNQELLEKILATPPQMSDTQIQELVAGIVAGMDPKLRAAMRAELDDTKLTGV